MCFVQHFNLLALILVIFVFGCSTAFVSHSAASYTVLQLSCFCIFFFPPSYAISLSSSNSVSLAVSPFPQISSAIVKIPSFNLFKFHLVLCIHQFSSPVVVDQVGFYRHF